MKKLSPHTTIAVGLMLAVSAQAKIITVNTENNGDFSAGRTNLVTAISLLADRDTIAFNIPGAGVHYLLTPANGYPLITNQSITIDGYSQPGAIPNSNPIHAANNAQLKIVLSSTNGNGTPIVQAAIDSSGEAFSHPGFNGPGSGSDYVILAFFRGTNNWVKGLAFQSTVLPPSDPTGKMIGIGFMADDPIVSGPNANGGYWHVSGCWFGLNPATGQPAYTADGNLASPYKSIDTERNRDGAPANTGATVTAVNYPAPGTIGVAAGSANPRAEFNVFLSGWAINLTGPNYRMSGNFFNILPDGMHNFDIAFLPGAGVNVGDAVIEVGRQPDNILIGTDGDGVNDDQEGNVFGGASMYPLSSPAFSLQGGTHSKYFVMDFYYSPAPSTPLQGTNIVIAGNYFGVAVDSVTRFTNSTVLMNSFNGAGGTARFGSDFDGVSDALEANLLYNNYPFSTQFPDPGVADISPESVFDGNGQVNFGSTPVGARLSFRGNVTVGNDLLPFKWANGLSSQLDNFTNYEAPYMVTSGSLVPLVDKTNIFPIVHGTFPPGVAPYNNIIIDVYELDPEGWANGKLFAEPELTDNATYTNGFPQGKKYLGSFPVANTGTFTIDLTGKSTTLTLTVAANYSADPAATHNGRVHTGNFSDAFMLIPGGAQSVGLAHTVPDMALWYNSANYFTNGPVNVAAQVAHLATWEPYLGLLSDSTFLVSANTFVDDGTAQNMRPALIFQPAGGGPPKLGTMFYDDSGHAYTNKHHEFAPPQSGDLGRVGGDKRFGGGNFLAGVAVAFYNYPTFFNSDGRFDVADPFYNTLAGVSGRDTCVQSYSLNPSTLAQTPLCKALDSAFGRCCTNASYPNASATQLSRLQHALGLSDGNFVAVVEDRSELLNPTANAAVATIFRADGSVVKEAFKIADGDQWSNVAAFRGGFCVRHLGILYFFDNAGNLQGSVDQVTSGLPFGTSRGDETRIASDIRSYYVYLAGRTPDSTQSPVSVAIWDSRTRAFVTSATISETDPTVHAVDLVDVAVDALDRFCVVYPLKPTADFLTYQVVARVMSFNGANISYLTPTFFPFVNYDRDGSLGLLTDSASVAMTTRQICISAAGIINSTNNPAAGPDTSPLTDVYTVISHPAPVAAPVPDLTVTRSGGNMILSWSADAGLFTVQTTPQMKTVGTVWTDATSSNVSPPVSLPISVGNQYVRLIRRN